MATLSPKMLQYMAKFAASPHDDEYDDIRHTQYVPPHEHFETVRAEQSAAADDRKSSRRTRVIVKRAMREPVPAGLEDLDWAQELAQFSDLEYPAYYLQPVHSVAGGWLSKRAAVQNRMFMQGIYKEAHPDSCMGLRVELSKLVPQSSRLVVDLGCGDGDGPACTARQLPSARVLGIDASPFMLIAGRTQNPGLPNLELKHALAEATGLPDGCADCVTITLVFHECNDMGKVAIAQEAKRILRPGGSLIFSDTPQDDLQTYVGAYEPYRREWASFDPAKFFSWLGFGDFQDFGILGGDGAVVSAQQHRELVGERTDNRLFVCTMKKSIPLSNL